MNVESRPVRGGPDDDNRQHRISDRRTALAQTEKDFQAAVTELAIVNGWRSYHTHDSRRSAAGFPDLFMVRPPRIVIAELKTERGRPTRDQKDWLGLLERCPQAETYLWRPSDWSEIERVLARRAA